MAREDNASHQLASGGFEIVATSTAAFTMAARSRLTPSIASDPSLGGLPASSSAFGANMR